MYGPIRDLFVEILGYPVRPNNRNVPIHRTLQSRHRLVFGLFSTPEGLAIISIHPGSQGTLDSGCARQGKL